MFRDFIPDKEMEGEPFGNGGYQDFVPTKKPVKHEDVVEVEAKPVKSVKKAKSKK